MTRYNWFEASKCEANSLFIIDYVYENADRPYHAFDAILNSRQRRLELQCLY